MTEGGGISPRGRIAGGLSEDHTYAAKAARAGSFHRYRKRNEFYQTKNVPERHTILSDWLLSIGVSRQTALEGACRMEHDLSEESFEAIKGAVRPS